MKIKHYDAGERFYGPMSGEHVVALCGVSWQACKKNHGRTASNPKEISCIRCKRAFEKLQSIVSQVASEIKSKDENENQNRIQRP